MKKTLLFAAIAALLIPPAFAQRGGQRGQGGRQRGGGQRGGFGGGGGGGGQRGGFGGGGGPTDPLAGAIDTNKDGVLSADELEKASGSLKSLDADGDGTIDANEIRNAMRASFGGGRGGTGGRGGRGGGPGSAGSSTLERAGLALNQTAPDVTIHNDKGDNVRLADFKGKHTVIVFGCLT
jgi:hypothetical protein